MATLAARLPVALNVSAVRDPAVQECELIYTWGKVIASPRKPPFVVELDNPYVLTLYHNVAAFRRMRPVLRRVLLSRRCAGIVCISEACRRSLEVTLGPDVSARARTVYPYVGRRPLASPGSQPGPLRVLLVGTQYWVKGGREACRAVARLARGGIDVHLTVVSRVPDEVRRAHARDPIEFVDARLSRDEVTGRLMPGVDVLLHPTLQESFGMVVLEALSAGLPVVATDVYALGEMVVNEKNGRLLPDRLGIWRAGQAVDALWALRDIDAHVRERNLPGLTEDIESALRDLALDRGRVRAMGEASHRLFEERFAPEVRATAIGDALQDFLGRG